MASTRPTLGLLLGGKSDQPAKRGSGPSEARKAAAKALLAAIKADDADAISEALGLHSGCPDDEQSEE